MNRLKLLILVFFFAVSIPLAFLIWHSYSGLEQEERAQLRFFSETLFDQIERELASLVQIEEERSVDEYHYYLAVSPDQQQSSPQRSPLAVPTEIPYILGYVQNNPDGSFQTPLLPDNSNRDGLPDQVLRIVAQLQEANERFNQKKFSSMQPTMREDRQLPDVAPPEKDKDGFAERFLRRPKTETASSYLGKKQQRVEEISAEQALNIASDDESLKQHEPNGKERQTAPAAPEAGKIGFADVQEKSRRNDAPAAASRDWSTGAAEASGGALPGNFQVEVAPFQSVAIGDDQVFVFRRIVINNEIYRQGFVILVEALLQHLADDYFAGQPLANFTSLTLQRRDLGEVSDLVQAGAAPANPGFLSQRIFPAPFDFLSVTLRAAAIPASPARRSLNGALAVLGGVMVLGFVAIYLSARTIVAMSEKRSQFVSSVTHELKTPLTNIRMYVEMLEQGIGATPEKEQEYLAIIGHESGRLSALINNVLELARLEKRQRYFHLREGRLDDVLSEVQASMSGKLRQEGFTLTVEKDDIPLFAYDREVLVQIVVNLLGNSLKFGKQAARREILIRAEAVDKGVRIAVSDTGPGIPRHALDKVFDEFYRVDNELTRRTGGTGIGLALVRQFVTALGGTVQARNNDGPGCTIAFVLPI